MIDQDNIAGTPTGVLLSFGYSSTGALTPVTGTKLNGVSAGTTPAGIAVDPTGHFIYVTDSATNQLYAYSTTSTGATAGAELVSVYDRAVFRWA